MISRRELLSGAAAVAAGAALKPMVSSLTTPRLWKGPATTVQSFIDFGVADSDITGLAVYEGKMTPVFEILVEGVWKRLGTVKSMDLGDGAVYDLRYNEIEIG